MPKALAPGDDKGITILIGGKRSLKIGDLMGSVIVPFMKLETDEDYERFTEFAERVIEFFAEISDENHNFSIILIHSVVILEPILMKISRNFTVCI